MMDQILNNLFDMSEPWPEKVIRSVVVYLLLFFALRLAGKRELGSVSTADLIVVLLLSNTVQNAIIGDDTSMIGGLAGAAILLLINRGLVLASYHSRAFRRMMDGLPVDLVVDGEVNEHALSREQVTLDELAMVDPRTNRVVRRVELPGCDHPHGLASCRSRRGTRAAGRRDLPAGRRGVGGSGAWHRPRNGAQRLSACLHGQPHLGGGTRGAARAD